MIAICLRGPPAVGKTTLAYEVGIKLKELACFGNRINYLSGDMIAHISLGCRYNEDELGLKYKLIGELISILSDTSLPLILDDTFQRSDDYQNTLHLLIRMGYDPIYCFYLNVAYKVAYERNRNRYHLEQVPDGRFRLLHSTHHDVLFPNEIQLNTILPIEVNASRIIDIVCSEQG